MSQNLMAKRKPPIPRLSWRDPNMPVLGKSGKPIPHEKMTLKAQMMMAAAGEPTYKNDPTYNLRRKR